MGRSRYPCQKHHIAVITPPNIQPKLGIWQPNDKYEQEAENVATEVVNKINTPPSTSQTDYPIQTQTRRNPTYQIFDREVVGISVDRKVNTPTFQEIINLPGIGQQNIQTRRSQTVTAKSNKASSENTIINATSRDRQHLLAHKLTYVNSQNGNKINKINVGNVVQTNLFNDTKKKIQNVSETVLGALAGEFNNDPSVTQIIIDGIISLIPILDQIADGRDIAAHIYFMTSKGEYNKSDRWIGLAFSLIGCVPELGTVIKSASKLLFKGTAKVLPHSKELLQLISKILPNGTVNSFSSFLSQNWHKYVQQGTTKWKEILNQFYGAVNFIPGILLQKKTQVLNKLKEIQSLSGTMLKSAFDTIWQKISKVLDDIASELNPHSVKLNTNATKWLNKHRNNVIKKYGADGMKMLSEGVIAKRVTKEGHTLKVLANGKIVRCSTCSELAKEFAQELNGNKKLSNWLKNVQKRSTENPEGVADEIAIIEKQLQNLRKSNSKVANEISTETTKPKMGGGNSEDIKKMMRSQKVAPDIVNKGVHFNVDQVELKLVTSGNTLELQPVFSSYKKADVTNAIRKGSMDLRNSDFQQWLLKHAKAGLQMAEQLRNTERVEYFKEVIKIMEVME